MVEVVIEQFGGRVVFYPSTEGLAVGSAMSGEHSIPYLYNDSGVVCAVPFRGTLEVSWVETGEPEEKTE